MKAIVLRQPGTFDVLQFEEVPTPTPNAGEVLISVAVAGVNYADMMIMLGRLLATTAPKTHKAH